MDTGASSNTAMSSFHFYENTSSSDYLLAAIHDGVDEVSLLIAAREGSLPQVNPKRLKDNIVQNIDHPQQIVTLKRTRQGKVLLVTTSAADVQKLLGVTEILDTPVESYVLKETITTRFLLHNMDPTISCQEIAEELQYQGIVALEVRRFLKKINGSPTPTPTVLVTKLRTTLPYDVRLWYQYHRLTLFYDNPRPCLNCNQFNHGTKSCRNTHKCVTCSENHSGECSSPILKCSNCDAAHAATDKSCPHYVREMEIQKFKSQQHLTIGEARRQFSGPGSTADKSYAQMTSTTPLPAQHSPPQITKADLDATMEAFTDRITSLFQEVLVAQAQSIQHSIDLLAQTIQQSIVGLVEKMATHPISPATAAALAVDIVNRIKKPRLAAPTLSPQSLSCATPNKVDRNSNRSNTHTPG